MFQRHSLGCQAHTTDSPASVPTFLREEIEGGRTDGYWIQAFPFHTSDTTGQNIIGYGLGTTAASSTIEMFLNPHNPKYSSLSKDRSVLCRAVQHAR